MSTSKFFLTLLFLTAVPSSFGQTPSGSFTFSFSFAPVGLASGDTMQINLVNLAADIAPGQGVPPATASCSGNVSFVNAGGMAIGNPSTFSVGSGVTQSVSLPFANSGISNMRGEVRAVVAVTEAEGVGAPPCGLAISLEVFDANNATHVYLNTVVPPSPARIAARRTNSMQ
ncbi:MAG TPA: hypothetical protein VKS01_06565 [Bryobacteraceae bacterium]|nr:hypothetical protein [Bryobacteraceae bacterium]